MRKIVQVRTREDDVLAEAVAAADRAAGAEVEVLALKGEKVDYQHLLEAIFKADSVQSW